MKKIIFLMLFVLLTTSVVALECQRVNVVADIPCNVTIPYTLSNACSTYNVSIHGAETITNVSLENNNQNGLCFWEFEIETVGTYQINTTFNENGIVVVKEGSRLIAVIIFLIVLGFGLIAAGIGTRDPTFAMLGGMLITIMGAYVQWSGLPGFNNWVTGIIALILVGIGLYVTLRTAIELLDDAYGTKTV